MDKKELTVESKVQQGEGCGVSSGTPFFCYTYGFPDYPFSRPLSVATLEKTALPLIKRSHTYQFPDKNDAGSYKIDYLSVTNKMPKGEEGTVTLVEGGVGFDKVKLNLQSQRGKGFKFFIEIRGRKV